MKKVNILQIFEDIDTKTIDELYDIIKKKNKNEKKVYYVGMACKYYSHPYLEKIDRTNPKHYELFTTITKTFHIMSKEATDIIKDNIPESMLKVVGTSISISTMKYIELTRVNIVRAIISDTYGLIPYEYLDYYTTVSMEDCRYVFENTPIENTNRILNEFIRLSCIGYKRHKRAISTSDIFAVLASSSLDVKTIEEKTKMIIDKHGISNSFRELVAMVNNEVNMPLFMNTYVIAEVFRKMNGLYIIEVGTTEADDTANIHNVIRNEEIFKKMLTYFTPARGVFNSNSVFKYIIDEGLLPKYEYMLTHNFCLFAELPLSELKIQFEKLKARSVDPDYEYCSEASETLERIMLFLSDEDTTLSKRRNGHKGGRNLIQLFRNLILLGYVSLDGATKDNIKILLGDKKFKSKLTPDQMLLLI